jgi:hypothetical protein
MRCGFPLPGPLVGALLVLWQTAASAGGVEPLHRKVDRAVEAKIQGEPTAPATDAEFLHRVCLDLTGMIPTSGDARAFLDDPSPYKRAGLIERLLASPQYARRMQDVFDVMLMERRADTHVRAREWRAFLRQSFAANIPYDRLVGEILAADGSNPETRGAAKFYLDRLADPNLLTRDISRMFLGRDIQCAQCHDHPLIDDYKQAHYYGLFAFLNRTTLFEGAKDGSALAEKADGDVTFASVFKKKVTHRTGPRVLDGPEIAEPKPSSGSEYVVFPEKDQKTRSIPRHSRRAMLPARLTSGAVTEFSRNIVNRLWAMLLGRGLVHPVDLHHSENPPADAELLDLLAREFVAMGYDVKTFLRELALTRVYQQSSEPPPGAGAGAEAGADKAPTSCLAVAPLKPLTPEQLAWTMMQGLGVVASARQQAEQNLDGHDSKLRDIFRADAKRRALRASLIEEAVHDQLEPAVAPFVHQFAAVAGQSQDPTEPSVHQALFLSNGGLIESWLAPTAGNLVGRLAKLGDTPAISEELYLSLFSRRPTDEERAETARYLDQRGKDRVPALRELAWALLESTEFRFNH